MTLPSLSGGRVLCFSRPRTFQYKSSGNIRIVQLIVAVINIFVSRISLRPKVIAYGQEPSDKMLSHSTMTRVLKIVFLWAAYSDIYLQKNVLRKELD